MQLTQTITSKRKKLSHFASFLIHQNFIFCRLGGWLSGNYCNYKADIPEQLCYYFPHARKA